MVSAVLMCLVCAAHIASCAVAPWLGVGTHFDQGWSPDSQCPLIPPTGAQWIRDNITWAESETSPGVYGIPQKDSHWLYVANTNGIKVDLCVLFPNTIYTDPCDPAAFGKWIGWLAGQMNAYPCVQAIEVGNEPNNNYAPYEKTVGYTDWRVALVHLMSIATPAIHSANPNVKVIGLGSGNTSDNLYMLTLNPAIDGIVDHPYQGNIVENGFTEKVKSYRSATRLPLWFNEYGKSTQYGSAGNAPWHETENEQAIELLRQTLLGFGLGVEHQFIYEFNDDGVNSTDNGSNFGIFGNSFYPKQLYYDLEKMIPLLQNTYNVRTPDQGFWGWNNQQSGFDSANLYTYGFQTSTQDVIAYWFGVEAWTPETFTATTWWYRPGFSYVAIYDPLSGTYTTPYWTYGGDHSTVVVSISVSERPKLLIVK